MAAKILQYDSIEDFIVHNQNSRFSNILLNNKDDKKEYWVNKIK